MLHCHCFTVSHDVQLVNSLLTFSKCHLKCISVYYHLPIQLDPAKFFTPLRSCLVHFTKAWPAYQLFGLFACMCIMTYGNSFASRRRKTLFIFSASLNTSYNKYRSDPQKMNQERMMVKCVAFINSHLLPTNTTKCGLMEEKERRDPTLYCACVYF